MRHKEQISYVIFGGFTTIINIAVYTLMTRVFKLDTMISNVNAWIISVFFAYITNKLFVFNSKSLDIGLIVRELISFICCRLFSGFVDMAFMYTFVNIFRFNDFIIKIISNGFVIIMNYFFSKLLIFRKSS